MTFFGKNEVMVATLTDINRKQKTKGVSLQMKPVTNDPLLSSKEAESYLGLARGTLSVWRSLKRYNLPYLKLGGYAVRYKKSDLDHFLKESMIP